MRVGVRATAERHDGRYHLRVRTAMLRIALVVPLVAIPAARARAQTPLSASRATAAPVLDGVLDESTWNVAPLDLGDWISYNPLKGEASPERTEVRVVYDDRYVYFAFHCFDRDPGSIRTTISRRDNAFEDDWIGFSLDSAGRGQTAYHLFVNPSGIQMDAVNTSSSGERFETDLVWNSAGRKTADGFVVEIAVPLETIRFAANPGGITMGVLFWRHFSRSGVSYSWPDMPPGQWVFNRHARLSFADLQPRRLIELLPSATWPLAQVRGSPENWDEVVGHPEIGLSAKYGITTEVTLDATVNPDFSQVESDAFQVEVNQRFPIFFDEKRPFFMEGLGLFNLATTGGAGNMRLAVHTRRIINPSWGTKLTGSAGRTSFGVLNASDDTPEDIGDRGVAVTDRNKLFTIARSTFSLGGSDYAGAIFTDTEHAGRHNRIAGADLSWKPTSSQEVSAMSLYSQTGVKSSPEASGGASVVQYNYDTRRFFLSSIAEHYDNAFQMDSAFYKRAGFSSSQTFAEVNFYPDNSRIGLIRWHPLVVGRIGHDRIQNGDDSVVLSGVRFHFTRQGFFNIERSWSREPWRGQEFATDDHINTYGEVQAFRWLKLSGYYRSGDAIYYDEVNPFQGRVHAGGGNVTWQPNAHFNQWIGYDGVQFDRADNGLHVFTVHILNSKTLYQFDRHFFVRLLEQFDSSQHRLLTDFLASYEFVPGTVAHAGYGSIYEKQGYEAGQFIPNTGNYLTVSRGLFFKASYLYRF